MRQVLSMFRAAGENQGAKVVFCGVKVDDRLQRLVREQASDLLAVSYVDELARTLDDTGWGCIIAGDRATDDVALKSLAQIAQDHPGFPWIVWSSRIDWATAIAAMQLGAYGVLRSPQDDADLSPSLACALRLGHERFVCWQQACDVQRRLSALSASEARVLTLILHGRTNKEIALEIDLSLRTVESRRQKILRIMQAENIVALATMLARHGKLEQILATDAATASAEPHPVSA